MKNFKFLLFPFLCLILAVSFVSCDKDDEPSDNSDNSTLTINGNKVSLDFINSAFNIENVPLDINLICTTEDNLEYDIFLEWECDPKDMVAGFDLTSVGLWMYARGGFEYNDWYKCTKGSVIVKKISDGQLTLQFKNAVFKDDQNQTHTIEINGTVSVRIHG